MFDKNWLPKPSPLLAPFTKPAISTISTELGIVFSGFTNSTNLLSLSSGIVTAPKFGSIVQKGKLVF